MSILCAGIVALSAVLPLSFPVRAEPSEVISSKRQIPVYRKSLSERETLECTFFSDLPDIPYIPLEVFYTTFMDGHMKVTKNGTVYTYEDTDFGAKAAADAEKDTLTSSDLADFIATPAYKIKGKGVVVNGPDQMVKIEDVQYDKAPSSITLQFGQYGIDLREENGVLYFPFASVSDLFSNTDVLTAYYINGNIYFEAFYDDLNGGEARKENPDHLPWILEASRPADMVTFSYRELCFVLDHFYGYPCTHNDFADAMRQNGADAAITAFDPEARQLLLSEKPSEYIAGLYRLFSILLADGGHTGIVLNDIFNYSRYSSAISRDFSAYSLYNNEGDGYYIQKNRDMIETRKTLKNLRFDSLGSGNYHAKGDTVLITFDDFIVNYSAWRAYVNHETGVMPNDTVGYLHACLERAKKDPAIRNVIFDISTNGGGDTIALNIIVGLVRNKFDCHFYNMLGDQTLTQTMATDRNLDGTVDSRDTEVSYGDLHFGVLASGYSFSCANMFTAMMKEGGCPVLGERSGGGACAVLMKATSDGLCYRLSSYLRFASNVTDSVDDGIPADISLVTKDAYGNKDYSGFYDLSAMSRAMNAYYGEAPESSADMKESSQPVPAQDSSSAVVSSASGASTDAPSSVPEAKKTSFAASSPASSGAGMTVLLIVIAATAAVGVIVPVIVVLLTRNRQR